MSEHRADREQTPPSGANTIPSSRAGQEERADSVGQLASQMAADLSTLVRKEFELAKTELKQDATRMGKASALLGGAGLGGYMTALFVSLAAIFGLNAVMDTGWAALIVAAVWLVIAGICYSIGRKRMQRAQPPAEQTVETLKEDARWARRQKS